MPLPEFTCSECQQPINLSEALVVHGECSARVEAEYMDDIIRLMKERNTETYRAEKAEAALAEEKRRVEDLEKRLAAHHPEEMEVSDLPGACFFIFHRPACPTCTRYDKALSTAPDRPKEEKSHDS